MGKNVNNHNSNVKEKQGNLIQQEGEKSLPVWQSHPSVIHLAIEAGPLVLQQAQILLGLGGPRSSLLSSPSQQHGLSLIQQAVVLLCSLCQLSLKLLHTVKTQM